MAEFRAVPGHITFPQIDAMRCCGNVGGQVQIGIRRVFQEIHEFSGPVIQDELVIAVFLRGDDLMGFGMVGAHFFAQGVPTFEDEFLFMI